IPALGHDEVNHDAKAPTCTDIGWDAYVTCKRCDYTTYVEKAANGHTWDAGTVTVDPTCVAEGNTHYECTVAECDGAKDEAIAIDPTAHTEDEAVEENRNEATCTEDGSYDSVVYCEDCTSEISRTNKVINRTGHNFDGDGDKNEKEPEDGNITKAPTCTEAGEIEFTCQNGCGTIETGILPAADHLAGEPQVVIVDSTCTVKGTKTTTVYCERVNNGEICGHQMSQTVEELELAPHTPAEAVEENRVDATCTEDGHYNSVVYCSVCETHVISNDTVTLDATGHKYDRDGDKIEKEPEDGDITTAPTCEEKGVRTFKCVVENCDGYETEDIAATGHDWEYVTSIKPTCTEPGKASSSLCITCGKYVKDTEGEGTEVPALGHSYTFVGVEAPSCTAAGSITSKCTRCQDVVTTVIDKLEHNEIEIPAVAPTCTEAVSTEGKKCSVCGEILQPTETIEATGHNGNVVVDRKESTCTESGYEAYNKCSGCGEIVKETEGSWIVSEIKILPVNKHNTVETTDSYVDTSCTAAGRYDYVIKCTECGEDIYRKTIEIPMLDHTEGEPATENVVEVTCTTDGKYDTAVYCTACNAELSRVTTIVTHEGHKEEIVPGTAVTCTVNGKTNGKKCSVCDEILLAQETIYAQGHTVVVDEYKAPTCTETGLKAGRHCGVCNDVLLAQEVIPSKGHTEKTVAGTAATCTTTGLTDGIVCSVCGTVVKIQETIPALKHIVEIIDGKPATCTETGLT
ncbi:MAG: hypothetical protein IJW74_02775, partial [Oscillospiraceae bacterium]|nr:hypothetical protein [Oscillospiraceae bacterium]